MLDVITAEQTKNTFFQKLNQRSDMELGDVIEKVSSIIHDVKQNRDQALIKYSAMFDKTELKIKDLKISQKQMEAACCKIDKKLMEVIKKAAQNIRAFHQKQKQNSWLTTNDDGVLLGQILRPLEKVGVYVPGGTAVYPSSVLMNVIPAKVAGVEKVIMVTPPGGANGLIPAILFAAKEAGVDEIYQIGGAQAIAALAFGTDTIPKVDKIVGPGNIYVAQAKKQVFGACDIDMIAGPSEITILADQTANPAFVAADMLSQAEHDKLAASIVVTHSKELAKSVQVELEKQLNLLERKDIAKESLSEYGAIILTENIEESITLVNKIAPEHLELCINEPFGVLGKIKNAGAIFLGHFTPEPLGDYFAGPNHVLPTGGSARFFSPLNIDDFVKKSSVISYTRDAFMKTAENVILFAEAEGLDAHANSVRIRRS